MKKTFLLTLGLGTIVALSSSATVLAVTALDFSTKSNAWASTNCTQKELDKTKVSINDAVCSLLSVNEQQDAEIKSLQKASPSKSSYAVHMPMAVSALGGTYYDSTGHKYTSEYMVPAAGNVSVATAALTSKGDEYIISGKIDFIVVVNGIESTFGTHVDVNNPDNVTSNGSVPVKAGDKVAFKVKSTDLIVKSPRGYVFGLSYNLGIMISQ